MIGILLAAGLASAQTQPPPGPADQGELRYQIQVMEGVFERAVRHGAQRIGRQMQSGPPGLFFTGPARARGFLLEGYGVFFDVDVPALRPSVTWIMRTFEQQNVNITSDLQSIRRWVQALEDARARAGIEQALRRIEVQVGAEPTGERTAAAASVGGGPAGVRPVEAVPSPPPPRVDPGEAYTAEVKRALIDAMLDYSGSLVLEPDHWLTVAARDNQGPLMPGEIYEASTIMLRVRGRDLAALRADRLTRDEARKRVEVREF